MTAQDFQGQTMMNVIEQFERGQISSEEITRQHLEQIDERDESLNAFITVLHDQALADARLADQRRSRGERLPLLGVPLVLKDLFETTGVRTTAGSRLLADHIPDSDATVVKKLRDAGAVILGKTNMMEFAYGYPHPDYGETRNPWSLERTAGGSSGGSAAAVAAGLALAGLGSDTGGSIRSPAAYCGIVGLKPTYGRISRHGVIPLSWSLDHVGPLTRTVADCALLFDVIAGYDPLDPASAQPASSSTASNPARASETVRIGIVEEFFRQHVEPEVKAVASTAGERLADVGYQVEAVSFPLVDLVSPTIMPIIQAEAASYHWPALRENPENFGPDVRQNLLLGGTVLAKDYLDAQRMRRRIMEQFNGLLNGFDALVFPTQPIVAPKLDAYQLQHDSDQSTADDVLDVEIGHTGLANLTGHPALSVPCGLTSAGLPVGLQFTGHHFAEHALFQIASVMDAWNV